MQQHYTTIDRTLQTELASQAVGEYHSKATWFDVKFAPSEIW